MVFAVICIIKKYLIDWLKPLTRDVLAQASVVPGMTWKVCRFRP